MRVLYTLGIYFYGLAIWIASFFDDKAARWISGRKHWREKLTQTNLEGCIWFHCASLGEFEQGRPLLEKLRRENPERTVLLTFFSPSGYEVRKNYPHADTIAYLPLDTPRNTQQFLKTVKPAVAIFVKYEVWHNFFSELSRQNIPLFLISAIFRQNQVYFKPYGKWFLRSLYIPRQIFTQDSESQSLLAQAGIQQATVTGDTRFDRVIEVSNHARDFDELALIRKKNIVIVAGSTWPADEERLVKFGKNHPEVHWIIAPHEIGENHIQKLRKLWPEAVLWSDKNQISESTRVVLINRIGLLSSLYKYGDIAYVGGGFGSGIHNTLEPAVFGIPVVFGPAFEKFKEARDLIESGGAVSVESTSRLQNELEKMTTQFDLRKSMGALAGKYVRENAGATAKISAQINAALS